MTANWHTLTLSELSSALETGSVTSVELTRFFLNRIQTHNDKLNSFISITAEAAEAQALKADQLREKGNAGPLTGIPIAHKDIFCTQNIKTSCGSKMLDSFISPYNATLVSRLEQAGMVLLGKTNMDEFAMGSSNETSYYGSVKNPWDLTRVPGGSSGGSAAAVAARLVPATTGTDTGGSIRQPAALTGITGLKPTYGRISRYGMIAFASSLDQAGPMTQTAEDAALMLEAMSGFDEKDSTSLPDPVPRYRDLISQSIRGLKIGLPQEFFGSGLSPAMGEAIHQATRVLETLGATLHPISLPRMGLSVPVYYVVAPAEASSNLARYDGVRFGHRSTQTTDLMALYKNSRSEGFGPEVKRRIMIGTYVLSSGYFDAYYLQAQKIRRLITEDFQKAFEQVDVILGPTTPEPAFQFGSKSSDPLAMYLSDIYTIAPNLAGLPSLSIPAGFIDQMPIGMQLTGSYLQEGRLLQIGHQYQQHTDWHRKIPEPFASTGEK